MKLLTINAAAKETGISKSKLRELVRSDAIPHVRYGDRSIRVLIADVHAWIESQRRTTFTPGRKYNPNIGKAKKVEVMPLVKT